MKRIVFLAALAACLLLAACGRAGQTPPAAEEPAPPEDRREEEALSLGSLTVELVVSWEEADRLLDSLDQLSGLLGEALAEQGCVTDEVRVTLSTAGGVTADALSKGGVDAAWLPAEDFSACGEKAGAALIQEGGGCVAAVTGAREELDGEFRALLVRAALDTEPGRAFLQLYCPGGTYVPAEGAGHGE